MYVLFVCVSVGLDGLTFCVCVNVCVCVCLAVGRIVDSILEEGFEISCAQLFRLTRGEAEEFLEVYKGVVPEYHVRRCLCCSLFCFVLFCWCILSLLL